MNCSQFILWKWKFIFNTISVMFQNPDPENVYKNWMKMMKKMNLYTHMEEWKFFYIFLQEKSYVYVNSFSSVKISILILSFFLYFFVCFNDFPFFFYILFQVIWIINVWYIKLIFLCSEISLMKNQKKIPSDFSFSIHSLDLLETSCRISI